MYDSSMKYKWDNKNVLDYAVQEAKLKGKLEATIKIAGKLKKAGLSVEFIAKVTSLSVEEIEKL